MSGGIEMTAFVGIECEARTLDDLRELVAYCDRYGIKGDVQLDWGTGKVYVEITGNQSVPAEWIECGDHMGDERFYDAIVPTHEHPEYYEKHNGPDNYEEALEMALEKPAKFDWPTRDRYGDEARPE